MAGNTIDVAGALRAGYTEAEIADSIATRGWRADTSGVPAWRAEQRAAAMGNAPVPLPSSPADVTAQQSGRAAPPDPSGHWSDVLPFMGGSVSGLASSALGPFSVPIAGAGQALGKGANIALRRQAGLPAEEGKDVENALWREGTMGALAQGGGLGANAMLGLGARGLMGSAMHDPVAARTALATRGTVGPKWGPWRSAEQIGRAGKAKAWGEIEAELSALEQAGHTADPKGFEAVLIKRLHDARINRTSDPQAFEYWQARLNQWRNDYGGHPTRWLGPNRQRIKPTQLGVIKKAHADEARRLYEAGKRAGSTPKSSLDEKYAKDLADWSRRQMETMSPGSPASRGIREMNRRYERYSRMEQAASASYNPRRGALSPATTVGHMRQYGGGHSFAIPALPPEIASRAALVMSSWPARLGVPASLWGTDAAMSTGLARNYRARPDATEVRR